MLTPLYLLFGLTAATCVIAYWADNLGKKLGKKRISLFNLRPRQTATLVTMASSVGIMILTLAVLLGFNRSLRWALFRYDFVNAQNRTLNERNQVLGPQAVQLQQQVDMLHTQARGLQQQKTESQRLALTARGQLQQVKGQLGSATQKFKAAQRGEADAKRSQARAEQQASQAQTRFASAQNRADAAAAHLHGTLAELTEVNARLRETRTGLTATKLLLTRAKSNLHQVEGNLTITMNLTTRNLRTLRTTTVELAEKVEAVKQLQGQVTRQQTELTGLQVQQKTLEDNVTYLKTVAGDLYAAAAPLSQRRILLDINQVLAERTLPAHVNADQARNALRLIMEEGTQVVGSLERGSTAKSLRLAPLEIDAPIGRKVLNQDEILSNLTDYLMMLNVAVSVRLVTTRVYGQGEPLILGRLVTLPITPTYKPGDMICWDTVDGRLSDARIFNQLLKIVDAGAKKARETGMDPLLSEDAPNFCANDTNERIFEALRRIQALHGPAKVKLVADADLTTVDQLHVRFNIAKEG